jgi:ankyrin repeat protein
MQADSQGLTALHAACANNHTDTVRAMIEEFGADISITDNDGMSPLHWAAQVISPLDSRARARQKV